ncbi:hypothetical protein StoSoilA2_21530 [Arthrobacter sp. StoSoilA2]|nr:hypothetical protein StoSoilA2_21530 [Arthrobacter sp. StoSoilA2]
MTKAMRSSFAWPVVKAGETIRVEGVLWCVLTIRSVARGTAAAAGAAAGSWLKTDPATARDKLASSARGREEKMRCMIGPSIRLAIAGQDRK